MPAQNGEYLIYGVKFDNTLDEARKKTYELEKAVRSNKQAQKEANDALKKNLITEEQHIQKTAQLKEESRRLSVEMRQQTGVIDTIIAANKGAAGSYEKLYREQKAAEIMLKTMEDTLKRNEDGTYELTEEYIKQRDEVAKAKDALIQYNQGVNNGTLNVGRYAESMLTAADNSGLLATAIAKAKAAQEGLTNAHNIAKSAMMGNISVLKLLKIAMASTGIGLLLLAFGGLISYLTKTQEGIDWVSQKTKGLQTVFAVLTDKLSDVGEAIFKAFDNPKQAIKDLIDLIGVNLLNRAKAFLVIWEGIKNADQKKVRDGILQLATGIEDAAGKAKALVREMNEVRKTAEGIEKENIRIRDAERDLNTERAKSRAILAELRLISSDTTKSTAERAAAARKAMEIELALDAKRQKLQQDKIDNIRAEQDLTKNLTADNDKLAEAVQAQAEMASESLILQKKLQSELNNIQKEGANAAAKADADRKAREEQEAKEAEERAKAQAEAFRKISEEEYKTTQEVTKRYYDQLELAQKEAYANGLINETQYSEYLTDLKLDRLNTEIANMQDYSATVEGLDTALIDKRIELAHYLADEQIQANARAAADEAARHLERMKQAEEMEAFVGRVNDVFAASLTEQGVSLHKFGQGVVMLVIDTLEKTIQANVAAALASSAAQSMAQPDSVATFGASGLIRAALIAGLIKAAFSAFKATVGGALNSSAPAPHRFAEGGVLSGPSHEQGGIKGTGSFAGIEVEGDEIILTKGVYKDPKLRAAANALNIAGGGRALFPSKYMAGGGIVTRSVTDGSQQQAQLSQQIAYQVGIQMQNLPPIYTKITDINRAQKGVMETELKTNI
jgi:hypothetical protein